MSERHGSTDTGFAGEPRVVPWDWLERHASWAFATGGAALVASVVVPVGLQPLTEWGWATGLVLVGVAVVLYAAGLLGLYPTSSGVAPRLSSLGAVSSGVAGVAGLAMVAMGLLAVAAGTAGVDPGKPMVVFAAVALSMGLGLAMGLVASGIALWTTPGTVAVTPGLLTAGGAALLVPVGGQLVRLAVGVAPPAWLLFPALAVLALDGLAIGYALRRPETGVGR